jgi:hypothetical protein
LQRSPEQALGLDLLALRAQATDWLRALQQDQPTADLPPPKVQWLPSDGAL